MKNGLKWIASVLHFLLLLKRTYIFTTGQIPVNVFSLTHEAIKIFTNDMNLSFFKTDGVFTFCRKEGVI